MSNYRITAFDGVSFTQSGIYTTGGTVGDLRARIKPLMPPHSVPLDPYGGNSAPLEYLPVKTKLLITGDPDDVKTLVNLIRAKVGENGTLTGQAGSGTATRTAYLTEISGDWDAPFKDGSTQWLHITATFLPMTDWA